MPGRTVSIDDIQFEYASDQSLLVKVESGSGISQKLVRSLRALQTARIEGVLNLHPAYESILIVFDPLVIDHDLLMLRIGEVLAHLDAVSLPAPRTIEIKVQYGGEHGPDLNDIAALHRLTPEQVITLHSQAVYIVRFFGFVPGFAYLEGLPTELATPRLAVPRQHVPAGSVGIGGNQTGIYPFATPGGWRLIGRTQATLFDTTRGESLMGIGDLVHFVPA